MTLLGVIGNDGYPQLTHVLDIVTRTAADAGLTLAFEPELCRLVPGATPLVDDTPIDGVLTLGGDGTFLRGARWLDGHDLPVLGINLGRLGFLTACGVTETERALRRFAAKDYIVEVRMMLEATRRRADGGSEKWYALNDVVLHSGGKARVIRLIIDAGSERMAAYAADGLIVSTPTGSSAYSLSSGGPIIAPQLDSVLLTAISPHALTIRPVIISPETVVTLRVEDDESEQLITVDGQQSADFHYGDSLIIKRATRRTSLVRFPETTFFARLRDKMGWGGITPATTGEWPAIS